MSIHTEQLGVARSPRLSRAGTGEVDQVEVTVLLPCLNESETLAVCVRKAMTSLRELGVRGEVLVSDNGSTDGSQRIAIDNGARVVHAPVRGYGAALLNGIRHAHGRYIIMADADDSYDLAGLGPFVERLRAGHDVVMGNRFRGGISPGAMPPLHRYLGNPVLSWLGRRLFGLRSVGDFHCGIRGFNADRIRQLDLCMPGMEFASELVVRAAQAGYDIVEVPTTLKPDGRSRPPHLKTWRDGWRHLRFLLAFAPHKTLVLPGLVLAVLGLAGTALLEAGPVWLGRTRLDIGTLAYGCLAVLVGVLLLLFGGFAAVISHREYAGPHRPPGRWMRFFRLELCLLGGLLFVLGGVLGSVFAVGLWGESGFTDLVPAEQMRLVLPSATSIAVGVTMIFAGLLVGLLTARPLDPGAGPTTCESTVDSGVR